MPHRGSNGRPAVTDGEIENLRSLFEDNPRLSIGQAESLLNMPRSIILRVLRKCLFLYPYKRKNLNGITNADKSRRVIFSRQCQNQHENMSEYFSECRIDIVSKMKLLKQVLILTRFSESSTIYLADFKP